MSEHPDRFANTAIKEIHQLINFNIPSEETFLPYRPQYQWYTQPEIAFGIHGISHATRVLIWQELIAEYLANKGVSLNRQALRWAAVFHDTQRRDDFYDLQHGERAADWVKQTFATKFSPSTLQTLIFLIRNHVNHDDLMTPELKVFKDADGLDRVRIPGELDPSFFRIDISNRLVDLAELLFNESTTQSGNPFMTVINTAKDLNLIK